MEFILTFTFTAVFLLVKNKFTTKGSDEIVKGFAVAMTLLGCLSMSYGSGGGLNPALAVAQTIYYCGVIRKNAGHKAASQFANYLWVYFFFPLFGAVFAAVFAKVHQRVEGGGSHVE